MALPLLLTDCISKDRSECELVIVRSGESAAMAKAMRDRRTQAVLGVDSTIIGADAELDETLDDRNVKNIICALGVGIALHGFDDMIKIEYLRYERIIVAMGNGSKGRDAEGRILGLMDKYMGPLVSAGRIYTASVSEPRRLSEEELLRSVMSSETRVLTKMKFV